MIVKFPSFSHSPCSRYRNVTGREKERCDLELWFGNSQAISQPQGLCPSFCPWHIPLVLTAWILCYHFCFPSPPFQPPTQYRKCSPALAEGVGKGKPCLIPEHTAEKGLTVTGMSVMLRTSTAIRFFHVPQYPCAYPMHGQHQDHHPLPTLCMGKVIRIFSCTETVISAPLICQAFGGLWKVPVCRHKG